MQALPIRTSSASDRARSQGARRVACPFRQSHRRGNRKVGQGDPGGQHQAGVIRRLTLARLSHVSIWVPDLDSPSYFVAVAAVELGFFKQQGIPIEFVHNTNKGPELMREGKLDFIAGPAYAATRAFPAWEGLKLLCALSQYSYWFMAVRSTLNVKRGDLEAIKGLRISAAPAWPESGAAAHAGRGRYRSRTRQGSDSPSTTPCMAIRASWRETASIPSYRNTADAYWGNGMRVALGESLGIAKLHSRSQTRDGPRERDTTTLQR